MDNTGALFSVLIGLLCAGAGILALPKSGSPAGRNRAVLTGGAAAVPVLAWILWLGHPLATGLAFVVGTLIAGQLRDRRLGRSARGRNEAAVEGRAALESGVALKSGAAVSGAAVESGAAKVGLPEPRQDPDAGGGEQAELTTVAS